MSGPTLTSSSIQRIIARTVVSVTQMSTQGVKASQVVAIVCNDPTIKANCTECLKLAQAGGDGPAVCAKLCECGAADISMDQLVTCNFSVLQHASVKDELAQSLTDNLYLGAAQSGTPLPGLPDAVTAVNESMQSVAQQLTTDVFQTSLQSVQSQQSVVVSGSTGTTTHVNIASMLDVVEKAVQKTDAVTTAADTLLSTLMTAVEKRTDAGFMQIILRIVQIAMAIVIVIMTVFIVQITFTIMTTV